MELCFLIVFVMFGIWSGFVHFWITKRHDSSKKILIKQNKVKSQAKPKEFYEDDKYFFVYSDNEDKCPFCGGANIRGGSWAPDSCLNCHSVHFFGTWFLDK